MPFQLPPRQATVHSGISFTVNLDGHNIYNSSSSSAPYAGVRINTDGTVDKRNADGSYSQIDSGTDWVIPNGSASSDFDVYCTVVAGNLDGGDLEDTWLDLSTNREWWVRDTTQGSGGNESANVDISIRYNGGAALDTGRYNLRATYQSPPSPPMGMGVGGPILIASL